MGGDKGLIVRETSFIEYTEPYTWYLLATSALMRDPIIIIIIIVVVVVVVLHFYSPTITPSQYTLPQFLISFLHPCFQMAIAYLCSPIHST